MWHHLRSGKPKPNQVLRIQQDPTWRRIFFYQFFWIVDMDISICLSWWKLLFCFLYNFLYFLIVYTFALRVRILLVSHLISPSQKNPFTIALEHLPLMLQIWSKLVEWSFFKKSLFHLAPGVNFEANWLMPNPRRIWLYICSYEICDANFDMWSTTWNLTTLIGDTSLSFIIEEILQTSSLCN